MKKFGILVSVFLTGATIIAAPMQVNAASNAIGVNPRRDYTVAPGGKISDTVFVNNLNKTEVLNANAEIIDFQPKDQTGTPTLLLTKKDPTKWSLKPYLNLSKEFSLAAGQSKEVPFSITLPPNIGAGSYYSAIRFSAGTPQLDQPGQNVSLTGSAVTLIFVRVTGEAVSNLSLEKFGPFTPNTERTDGVYGSYYGATKPKYISYLVRNNGNLAEQPAGSVLIKDIFGKQYKLFENANPGKNLVLIGQTRRIDLCLNETTKQVKSPQTGDQVENNECNAPNLKPGRYTASLNLIYGDPGNSQGELKQTVAFWYLPPWFLIAIVVVLLVIAGVIWVIVNAIRNRSGSKYRSRR